jgi:hypothetical protein
MEVKQMSPFAGHYRPSALSLPAFWQEIKKTLIPSPHLPLQSPGNQSSKIASPPPSPILSAYMGAVSSFLL